MTKYDVLYEALQSQYETGELTLETAEYLNNVAYELYGDEMVEASRESKEYRKAQIAYSDAVDARKSSGIALKKDIKNPEKKEQFKKDCKALRKLEARNKRLGLKKDPTQDRYPSSLTAGKDAGKINAMLKEEIENAKKSGEEVTDDDIKFINKLNKSLTTSSRLQGKIDKRIQNGKKLPSFYK